MDAYLADKPVESKLKVGVRNCARCGDDHSGLVFKAFTIRPITHGDGVTFTHWALCPNTGEPIIMEIEKTEDEPPGD